MIWRSKDNNYWECIGAEITIDKFNENYYTFYDTTLEAGQSYYYKIYHKLNSYRYYFLYNDEKKYFNDF